MSFISATGMLEVIFTDIEHAGAIGRRSVPAALTFASIEGLQMQSMLQGTGLALLELVIKVDAPDRVGDSVWATIKVAEARPPSKNGRGIVKFDIAVFNQDNTQVMHYAVTRMMASREAS